MFKWRAWRVLEDLISRLKPDKDKLSLWLWGALFSPPSLLLSPPFPPIFKMYTLLKTRRAKSSKKRETDGVKGLLTL